MNKFFSNSLEKSKYSSIIQEISLPNLVFKAACQKKIDNKTKPVGSLGRLEELAVRMGIIQDTLNPVAEHKSLFVFAGDHGVAAEGVSAFPAEVTSQMVLNFLNDGAAINVLCRHYGIEISIIDSGVNYDFPPHSRLINKKVRKGTRNFAKEAAMTETEVIQAIDSGIEVFIEKYKETKPQIIGLGEMGIANSTSASAIISAITRESPKNVTGRGTGVDDNHLAKKIKVISKALKKHKPDPADGIDILKKIGGYEIAAIAGTVLAAAYHKTAVVMDGIISTAGGLVACIINPMVLHYIFAGHRSVEKGQMAALKYMGLEPLIDLNMRLGEGTGAAIAIDIIDTACCIMREMASFEEAGVSNKE